MAPSDCNTILTRGFSPPSTLISSGFSNNTKDECHVSLPYLGLYKATLRGEEWKFIRLSVWSFFFFFCSILPKFTAKPWQVSVSASVGVRKRCPPGRSALLENFLQSKTWATECSSPGKSSHAFSYQKPWEAIETLRLVCLNWKMPRWEDQRPKVRIKTYCIPLLGLSECWVPQGAGWRGWHEFSTPNGPSLPDELVTLRLPENSSRWSLSLRWVCVHFLKQLPLLRIPLERQGDLLSSSSAYVLWLLVSGLYHPSDFAGGSVPWAQPTFEQATNLRPSLGRSIS